MSLRTLISASALFSLGILVSRLLGLPREMLIAARFGTGSDANAAIALLIVPDFITAALVGGALGATLIPAFATRDKARVNHLFWQTMLASTLACAMIGLLLIFLLPHADYQVAMIIALSSLPLIGATSVFTAYLQYKGRFLIPAFGSAIFNVVILLVLWLGPSGLIVLAFGVMVAATIRMLAHVFAYKKAGGLPPAWGNQNEINRPLLSSYLHTSGASLLGILPFYIPYGLVALLSLSGFAVFNYAFKLLLFPANLVQSTIQMVLLPWFVRRKAESGDSSRERYRLSLQLGWAISLAVALSVTIAAQDIATLCFGYGEMTTDDVRAVGHLIAVGIWSMPGIVLIAIYQQMLYTHEKPKLVFFTNALLVALVCVLGIIGDLVAGEVGILTAFAISQTIATIMLAKLAKQHIHQALHLEARFMRIALTILLAFVPLAWAFLSIAAAPALQVAMAMGIGGVILGAGLWQIHEVKMKCRSVLAQLL